MDEGAVVRIARAQHGLISAEQVMEVGGTADQIDWRVATGRWSRQRRGVYVVGAAPPTWEQSVLAACLAAGADAMASHRTAARLWELVDRSGRIEVLMARDRRVRLSGVTVRRSRLVVPSDRIVRSGIPVTSLARTLVDVSVGQSQSTVGSWLDDSLRRHGLRIDDVRRCVARSARPGRPGLRSIRLELGRRLPGYDPGDSELEIRALHALRAAGLPEPVQQHPVTLGEGRRALLDLAYPDDLIAIELDGWDVHRTRTAFDRDRSRANELALLGWRIYRFTSSTTVAELARTVGQALAAAHDRPSVPAASTTLRV